MRATNGKGKETKATLPVMVAGADPLDAHILGWPDAIKLNEEVSTTLSGSFDNDGSFYGTMEEEQYVFRFFGISAELIKE